MNEVFERETKGGGVDEIEREKRKSVKVFKKKNGFYDTPLEQGKRIRERERSGEKKIEMERRRKERGKSPKDTSSGNFGRGFFLVLFLLGCF